MSRHWSYFKHTHGTLNRVPNFNCNCYCSPVPSFSIEENPNNLYTSPSVVANNRSNCKFITTQRSNQEPQQLSFSAPILGTGKNQITAEDLKNLTAHFKQHQKQERINSEQDRQLVQSRSGSFSSGSSNNNNNIASSCLTNGNQSQVSTSSRYKTELCRPFEENGSCKYGEKCQFAHGFEELRTLQRHPKYKTELCRTFHTSGFCPYGPRCHFIHNSEDQVRGRSRANTVSSSGEAISPLGSCDEDASPTFYSDENRFHFPLNSDNNMSFSFPDCSPQSFMSRRSSSGESNFINILPDLMNDMDIESAFNKNTAFMHTNLVRLASEYEMPTASCSKTMQDQFPNNRLSVFNSMGLSN